MNILLVVELYVPHVGGAEVVFQNIAERLAARGYRVTVVTTWLPGTRWSEVVNGVTIRRVLVPPFARRYWFTLFSLPRVLMEARHADVIHTTTYNAAFPAWVAARMMHKPCVITVHEILREWWHRMPMSRMSARIHQWLESLVFRLKFDQYIAVSHATQNRLASMGVPAKKIDVIYNGVDERLFAPVEIPDASIRATAGFGEQEYVFLYFGRPGMTKGVQTLLRSFHRVAAEHSHARLALILTPTPAAPYQRAIALINQSPAREHIVKLDPVERTMLPRIISASDCVVVPSLTEGFGFTAAEACAMRKPVVASRAGALPEVVSGAVAWAEPGDEDSLVRAMNRAIEGDFELVPPKQFSWLDTTEKHQALYTTLTTRS